MSNVYDKIASKNPYEKEFLQAVGEVVNSVKVVLDTNPEYRKAKILLGTFTDLSRCRTKGCQSRTETEEKKVNTRNRKRPLFLWED